MEIIPISLQDLYAAWIEQELEDDAKNEELQQEKRFGHMCVVNDFGELVLNEEDAKMLTDVDYEEEEDVSDIFGNRVKEYSVEECLPPQKSRVICLLEDTVSNKKRIVSAYYEGSTFWNTPSSHAEGIENSSSSGDGAVKHYDWKVRKWARADL